MMKRKHFIKIFGTMFVIPFIKVRTVIGAADNKLIFHSEKDFNCPRGIATELTMCRKCLKGKIYNKPYDNGREIFTIWASDCDEYFLKKRPQATCGCQGTDTCVCGYEESFCFSTRTHCPFCGRRVTRIWSFMHKLNSENKIIGIINIS